MMADMAVEKQKWYGRNETSGNKVFEGAVEFGRRRCMVGSVLLGKMRGLVR
jgi:hypothetical protein